jgi:hypothetical protein
VFKLGQVPTMDELNTRFLLRLGGNTRVVSDREGRGLPPVCSGLLNIRPIAAQNQALGPFFHLTHSIVNPELSVVSACARYSSPYYSFISKTLGRGVVRGCSVVALARRNHVDSRQQELSGHSRIVSGTQAKEDGGGALWRFESCGTGTDIAAAWFGRLSSGQI